MANDVEYFLYAMCHPYFFGETEILLNRWQVSVAAYLQISCLMRKTLFVLSHW